MKKQDRAFAVLCAELFLGAVAWYLHSCAQRVEVRP